VVGSEYRIDHYRSRLPIWVVHVLTRHFDPRLIRDGDAVPFTGIARPPTITMPRVKAITTGSIPSFLDVILNFAESDTTSTLADQDTWLAQIRAGRDGSGTGKLVMYGDDTWLKLFPDMFTRADGTSSFFVSVSNHHCCSFLCTSWVVSCIEQVKLNEFFDRTLPKWTKM
jgi:hypothetical protein